MKPFFRHSLLLASRSPRRRQLLSDSGFAVQFVDLDVEEDFPDKLKEEEIPLYLAHKKSKAYTQAIPDNTLLVTADTIVSLDGRVLNKPADTEEAAQMLKALSGNRHTVHTGVCVRSNERFKEFYESTQVYFHELSADMIAYYLEHYRPLDKAGAYGIQEFIGYTGIKRIEGCYYNVMGFPVSRFIAEIQSF